jgi:hypothetical protein
MAIQNPEHNNLDHAGQNEAGLPDVPLPLTAGSTISWIKSVFSDPLYEEIDTDDIMSVVIDKEWLSDDELLKFFRVVSIELAQSASQSSSEETARIFGRPIYYGLSLSSPYYRLWEKSFLTRSEQIYEAVQIGEWTTELDPGIDELRLISLIPLATAYELPLFEQLRNNVLNSLTEPEEEFLGYVAGMLGPGYYDGGLLPEILNIPSSKILCEIMEDWTQYRDLWTPEYIGELLKSRFTDQKVKALVAQVLRGDDCNDPDEWIEYRSSYWTDEEISEALSLCAN